MKFLFQIIMLSFLILASCKGNEISSYKSFPAFIKNYLDSISGGKFLIAEKGERWYGGCLMDKYPKQQFISASISSNTYNLTLICGGYVDTREKIAVTFNSDKVTSYKRYVLN